MNVPLLRQPRDSQMRTHAPQRCSWTMEVSQVHAWTGSAVRRELIRGNVVHFAILMNILLFLQSMSSYLVLSTFLAA